MLKLVLAWILVAVSALGCAWYAQRTSPPPPTLFEVACVAVQEHYEYVTCDGLDEPVPVISKVVSVRYYGFYHQGEKYIFVRAGLPVARQQEVILHESIHYILDHLDVLISRCAAEELARKTVSDWFGTQISPTWERQYGCDMWSTGGVQW